VTKSPTLAHECLAELVGTFLLIFLGTGAGFVSVATGALGLYPVAVAWGLAVTLAVYAVGAISGAHINPAITLALAAFRGFPLRKVIPFLACQLVGAFLASALLLSLFSGVLASWENEKGLVRGQPGSEQSAMVFGEYFPNPAIFGTTPQAFAKVSMGQAMAAEIAGTAILACFVFALSDTRNPGRPHKAFTAVFVGVAVSALICVISPLTQACFNPARDFGPRLVAYLAGWNQIAIPGPRGGFFTVYIFSPTLGALLGAFCYQHLIRRAMPQSAPKTVTENEPCDSLT
jgi:glycerol uptake facilitator protein